MVALRGFGSGIAMAVTRQALSPVSGSAAALRLFVFLALVLGTLLVDLVSNSEMSGQ